MEPLSALIAAASGVVLVAGGVFVRVRRARVSLNVATTEQGRNDPEKSEKVEASKVPQSTKALEKQATSEKPKIEAKPSTTVPTATPSVSTPAALTESTTQPNPKSATALRSVHGPGPEVVAAMTRDEQVRIASEKPDRETSTAHRTSDSGSQRISWAAAGITPTPPRERARALEIAFRSLAPSGISSRSSSESEDDTRKRARALAELAIESWLAADGARDAADICFDAGFVEQGVRLYVERVGDVDTAAKKLIERGQYQRASDLYLSKGKTQKATDVWLEWSRTAPDPLFYAKEIHKLGVAAAIQVLSSIMLSRQLTADSTESIHLHYRIACLLHDLYRSGLALTAFERIAAVSPGFRDVSSRLETLRSSIVRTSSPDPILPITSIHSSDPTASKGTESSSQISNESTPERGLSSSLMDAIRSVPSIEKIKEALGTRVLDLSTLELHYQLGLALAGAGKWDEARDLLKGVNLVSPGYKNAGKRAEELTRLVLAKGPTVFRLQAQADRTSRYTVLNELGRGGMAVVHRGHDEMLHRDVALKFLAPESGQNEVFMAFFQREARAAANLNHPGIVTIFDVGILDTKPFIAMEFVEGESIEAILTRTGAPLTASETIKIAEQVLSALDYAHASSIIHRDIKPANIMRTPTGTIKIMDFGLAKSMSGPVKATIVSGTPAYMSPEQISGHDVDARTDVFAFGVSLFEMLTNTVPFDGLDRSSKPRMILDLNPNVSKALATLIHRAIEVDRTKRWNSAAEMLASIRLLVALECDDLESEVRDSKAPKEASEDQLPVASPVTGKRPRWRDRAINANGSSSGIRAKREGPEDETSLPRKKEI